MPDAPAHRRGPSRRTRLTMTLTVTAVLVVAVVLVVAGGAGHGPKKAADVAATVPTTTSTTSPFHHVPPGRPTDQRTMTLLKTIGGPISRSRSTPRTPASCSPRT